MNREQKIQALMEQAPQGMDEAAKRSWAESKLADSENLMRAGEGQGGQTDWKGAALDRYKDLINEQLTKEKADIDYQNTSQKLDQAKAVAPFVSPLGAALKGWKGLKAIQAAKRGDPSKVEKIASEIAGAQPNINEAAFEENAETTDNKNVAPPSEMTFADVAASLGLDMNNPTVEGQKALGKWLSEHPEYEAGDKTNAYLNANANSASDTATTATTADVFAPTAPEADENPIGKEFGKYLTWDAINNFARNMGRSKTYGIGGRVIDEGVEQKAELPESFKRASEYLTKSMDRRQRVLDNNVDEALKLSNLDKEFEQKIKQDYRKQSQDNNLRLLFNKLDQDQKVELFKRMAEYNIPMEDVTKAARIMASMKGNVAEAFKQDAIGTIMEVLGLGE